MTQSTTNFEIYQYGMTESELREWALYRIGYYRPVEMVALLTGQASALLEGKPEHMRDTCQEHARHLINRANWIITNMVQQ